MEKIINIENGLKTGPTQNAILNALTLEREPADTDYICIFCGLTTSNVDSAKYSCYSCGEYKGWLTIGEAKKLGYYETE